MLRSHLWAIIFISCGSPSSEGEPGWGLQPWSSGSYLPDPELPPPGALTLEVSELIPGQLASWTAGGLYAGEKATFLMSPAGMGRGPCHPQGSPCVDLRAPIRVLGEAYANPAGVATLQFRVPSYVPVGVRPAFQAVTVVNHGATASAKSPPVAVQVIAPDTGVMQDTSVPQPLLPEYFGFRAVFAHEAVADIARPYVYEGADREPFIEFTLATADWLQGNTADGACAIVVDQPGTFPRAGWAAEIDGYAFGVDFQVTQQSVWTSNCTTVFDVDDTYLSDFISNIGMACTWGFAVTPDIHTDIAQMIQVDQFRGGYISFNQCSQFAEDGIDYALTQGFEVDANWELFANADPLTANEMLVSMQVGAPGATTTVTRLADGYFDIRGYLFYSLN
jgi:hypothetical protein